MMGHQTRTESLFYYFRLEDQIPESHLLRLIDRHVDLSFVRERLKTFYSSKSLTTKLATNFLPATFVQILRASGSRIRSSLCQRKKRIFWFSI